MELSEDAIAIAAAQLTAAYASTIGTVSKTQSTNKIMDGLGEVYAIFAQQLREGSIGQETPPPAE